MHLVPFFDKWTGSETKLDLKAMYRRPDPKGVTIIGPLPLRRHSDWAAHGYEYISLSSLEELGAVAPFLREKGLDPMEMRDCYDPRSGAFNVAAYLAMETRKDASYLTELQARVDRFGADAVIEMARLDNPSFELPAGIVVKKKAETAKAEKVG